MSAMASTNDAPPQRWRVVVYSLVDDDWVGLGGGMWTELHVSKDRFVAKINGERVMDEAVLGSSLELISPSFGEFESAKKVVTGLYFATDAEANAVAAAFAAAARKQRRPSMIERTMSFIGLDNVGHNVRASFSLGRGREHHAHAQQAQSSAAGKDDRARGASDSGLPVTSDSGDGSESRRRSTTASQALRQLNLSSEHQADESDPLKVLHRRLSMNAAKLPAVDTFSHDMHVTFNATLCRYEGLPLEWKHMNKQFGVELHRSPRVAVPGYAERIPAVLIMLGAQFAGLEGPQAVGIFRIAPDKEDCAAAKAAIDLGDDWSDIADVHVVANLIKIWFRELVPTGVLNKLTEADIYKLADSSLADAAPIVARLPPAQRALLLWLLDLMATVTRNEAENRMSPRNMSIVFAPNLYKNEMENPMAALTMAQKVADATLALLNWRIKTTAPPPAPPPPAVDAVDDGAGDVDDGTAGYADDGDYADYVDAGDYGDDGVEPVDASS
ncbi:Rho GTPase activation protein [Pelagophyceae sp. CCMP2097]|nr:Rho GTPase activation protein [Pelagophyceae sp. CCMP2097]